MSDRNLSISLVTVLRHNAKTLGFNVLPGGFVYIDELLNHAKFKKYTQEKIIQVVERDDKDRFHIDKSERRWKVRANQGHSMKVDVDLREITNPREFANVIHGTNSTLWTRIKRMGLSRMRRTHIHFSPGEPGQPGVVSGIPGGCDILIYIDMPKAMAGGIEFYVSANNVILTEGNENGILPQQYFKSVIDRNTRKQLTLN